MGAVREQGLAPVRPVGVVASAALETPRSRVFGIDVARCLAILGMFAVHVGPTDAEGLDGILYSSPHGRASLLFVIVAGVGVALATSSPTTPLHVAREKLLWRAALLLPLGLALQELDHGAAVILQDYAVLFLVALPVVGLRDRWLLVLAGASTIVGPLIYAWGRIHVPGSFARLPITLTDAPGDMFHRLVLSGPYPLVTWLAPFALGLWLGRRDLRSPVLRRRMLVWGTMVAVVAALTSRLLRLAVTGAADAPGWDQLIADTAHSQMPLWLVGSSASAVAVLGAALMFGDRLPRVTRPLVVTGQFALTVYVAHLIALHAAPATLTADDVPGAVVLLAIFTAASILLAMGLRPRLGKGPLEALMHLPWRIR